MAEIPWIVRKTAELVYGPLPTSTYEEALEYFLMAERTKPRFYR